MHDPAARPLPRTSTGTSSGSPTRLRTAPRAALALALVLAACSTGCSSGGENAPPPPRQVATPRPTPPAYTAPSRTPARSGRAPVTWRRSLAEAQAEARASGRLLFVTTTKPDCSICESFMAEVAPQGGARLNEVAVSYVYDILQPESSRLDGALRANLPGAVLMPLSGFLTPDLAWVHGWSGPRTMQEFLADIEVAARMQPRRTAVTRSVSGPALARVAFVNEFGETQWADPADAWPTPQDALGGAPVLAQVPVVPTPQAPEPAPTPTVVVIEATPPVDESLRSGGPVANPEAQEWSPPVAAPAPPVTASAEGLPAPQPLAAPDPSASAPVAMGEAEARQALAQAFDLLRQGQLDRARDELRRVSRSLPGTPLAREADRGGAAVYHARRIAEAGAGEREALSAQARKSLAGSMWAPLF